MDKNKVFQLFDLSRISIYLNHYTKTAIKESDLSKLLYDLQFLTGNQMPAPEIELILDKNKDLTADIFFNLCGIIVPNYTDSQFNTFYKFGIVSLNPYFPTLLNCYIQGQDRIPSDTTDDKIDINDLKKLYRTTDWTDSVYQALLVVTFINQIMDITLECSDSDLKHFSNNNFDSNCSTYIGNLSNDDYEIISSIFEKNIKTKSKRILKNVLSKVYNISGRSSIINRLGLNFDTNIKAVKKAYNTAVNIVINALSPNKNISSFSYITDQVEYTKNLIARYFVSNKYVPVSVFSVANSCRAHVKTRIQDRKCNVDALINSLSLSFKQTSKKTLKSETLIIPFSDIKYLSKLNVTLASIDFDKQRSLKSSNLVFLLTDCFENVSDSIDPSVKTDTGKTDSKIMQSIMGYLNRSGIEYEQLLFISNSKHNTEYDSELCEYIDGAENIFLIELNDKSNFPVADALFNNALCSDFIFSDYDGTIVDANAKNKVDKTLSISNLGNFMRANVENRVILSGNKESHFFSDDSLFSNCAIQFYDMLNCPFTVLCDGGNNFCNIETTSEDDPEDNTIIADENYKIIVEKIPELDLSSVDFKRSKYETSDTISIINPEFCIGPKDLESIITYIKEFGIEDKDIEVRSGSSIVIRNISDEDKRQLMLSDFKKHLKSNGVYELKTNYVPYLTGRHSIDITKESYNKRTVIEYSVKAMSNPEFEGREDIDTVVFIGDNFDPDGNDYPLLEKSEYLESKNVDLKLLKTRGLAASNFFFSTMFIFNAISQIDPKDLKEVETLPDSKE